MNKTYTKQNLHYFTRELGKQLCITENMGECVYVDGFTPKNVCTFSANSWHLLSAYVCSKYLNMIYTG